jgi:hypothetical protein
MMLLQYFIAAARITMLTCCAAFDNNNNNNNNKLYLKLVLDNKTSDVSHYYASNVQMSHVEINVIVPCIEE